MPTLGDIQVQLEQTSGAIEGFRASVADGVAVDLTGLDKSIEVMCDAINALAPDQRLTVKATLIGLLDAMNSLVEDLKGQQDEISEDLKGVSSRQQAVSAYGKGLNTKKAGQGGPSK